MHILGVGTRASLVVVRDAGTLSAKPSSVCPWCGSKTIHSHSLPESRYHDNTTTMACCELAARKMSLPRHTSTKTLGRQTALFQKPVEESSGGVEVVNPVWGTNRCFWPRTAAAVQPAAALKTSVRIPQGEYEEEMRLPSAGGTGDGGHCCRCAVPGALFCCVLWSLYWA